jgi:hypothetical protein
LVSYVSTVLSHLLISPFKIYVKGYLIDFEKIRKLVRAETSNDRKVHHFVYIMMKDFIDKDLIFSAMTLVDGGVGEHVAVVSLGEGSLGSDVDELRKKDLPISSNLNYLTKLPSALTGPDVFEFLSW